MHLGEQRLFSAFLPNSPISSNNDPSTLCPMENLHGRLSDELAAMKDSSAHSGESNQEILPS